MQISAAQQVYVQVKNGLPGTRADVEHGPVAILDAALACDVGGGELAVADEFSILGQRFFQPANVLLRNHQHVRRSLRIDIVEGVGVLVFVDFLGGYFPTNDAAEQAVVHDTVHSSKFGDTPQRGGRQDGEGACPLYPIRESFAVRVLVPSESIYEHLIQIWRAFSGLLVESNQENRTLRSLSVVSNLFGPLAIVILHADSHPPVADRAAETLHLRSLVAVRKMIG